MHNTMREKSKIESILENSQPEDFIKYVKPYIIKFLLFFLLPFWVSVVINDGAALAKIIYWISNEVQFLEVKSYVAWSILIAAFPLLYISWFYYLVAKKLGLQLYDDFLMNVNDQLGIYMAESLLKRKNLGRTNGVFIADISSWINKKIARLPSALRWICRKLIDKIPYVELINGFREDDVEKEKVEVIARGLTAKLNEMTQEVINNFVPFWTKFIIPVNILLLIYYIQL